MSNTGIRWRRNFLTGLAIVLPAVISIAILVWLFGTVFNFSDVLLFFLPRTLTHQRGGEGPLYWYWSCLAFIWALLLVSLVGQLTRYYIGKKVIAWVDAHLLRVPLLNKIYGTVKQVNEAFTSNQKSSFKQVVLVEFPQPGSHAVGFVTGEPPREFQSRLGNHLVNVFVPTTPNPTGGFLLLVPKNKVIWLDMSVADGIKFIISLGAIAPEYIAPAIPASMKLTAPTDALNIEPPSSS
jgi:uncharacterized membrane protein